jgi:two-component system sensor histidine kinase VicK
MSAEKKTHIPYTVLMAFCACFWIACDSSRHPLPVGTRAGSDSAITPKQPFFESGRLIEARNYVDSAFHSLPGPTVYNYIGYYGTNAYVNAISGNYISQLKYLDSAITLLKEYLPDPGLSVELANLLVGRGEAHFNLKNYAASFDDYFQAMQVAKKYSDNCGTMRVVYNIAMILYKQQQFAESARYFRESLQYLFPCEKNIAYRNNKEQELLDNIGLCYTKLKNYDSAMIYYRKALELVENNRYKLAVDSVNSLGRYHAAAGVIAGNMAKVYIGTKRPDSAIALYKRAIALNKGHDIHDMQLCMIQLSDVYLSTGALQPMQQTLSELRASLDKWPADNDLEMEYERLMYLYYQKINDADKAIGHLGSYMHKKDAANEQQKKLQQSDIGKELRDKQQQFEIQLLQKNNQLNKTYLWVLVTLAVMAIVIMILVYTSYKASKRNVQQLTALNAAITSANREKDRILRVVAHDLRNPIGGIASLSQLLLTTDMGKEKTQEFIRNIAAASNSSIALINELLQVQQTDKPGHKKLTDINAMLQKEVNLMHFKAKEKKQEIILTLPKQRISLTIAPEKTERVIHNLVGNAIKFSPDGTTIKVNLELLRSEALITVADNGIGISPEYLAHVFDASSSYKQTGTAGEASFGLGLSICKQLIEEQGGKIWAESVLGKGSTFYVSLPVN